MARAMRRITQKFYPVATDCSATSSMSGGVGDLEVRDEVADADEDAHRDAHR